jgi:LuxR family transcriptional regulator, maltose regulon positive regulatory protein
MDLDVPKDNADQKWNVSLIQTKMAPQRLPPGCVQRPGLIERLHAHCGRTVTVVRAPAGFGKTTLLASWSETLSAQRRVVAWLSLDAEDDDPKEFGAYLVAAFCRASGEIGLQATRLLSNDLLTPAGPIISVLLNEIAAYEGPVFLVLDDIDRVMAKPVLATLARLLRYAPENLHVLLGARSDPALALGQLRAPERLVRIEADDLRFSLDDAQILFSQAGRIALDRPTVELLNNATEGWAAGLQLASLALRATRDASQVAHTLSGARLGTDSYLDDTVLAQLPALMLKFLLRTSILDRLSAGVCDAVMGKGMQSGEKLEWLERHNVFIRPLDEERQWFRCHALMSDALRRRAARQLSEDIPHLHRRASQWFADARLWPEAVKHALAAGEVQQAVQWVENCAMAMVEHGDAHTLMGWIAKLPPELVQKQLRLRTARALALALAMENTAAAREIEFVANEINASRESDSDANEALLAEVNSVSAIIAVTNDDSERALALGRAAARSASPAMPWVTRFALFAQFYGLTYSGSLEEVRRVRELAVPYFERRTGSAYEHAYRDYMYGLALLTHGELSEAMQFYETALSRAEGKLGHDSGVVAGLASCLSVIYYERNELVLARSVLTGQSSVAMDACPLNGMLRHTYTTTRLYVRDGNIGAALATLEDGRQIAQTRHWLRLRVGCDAETARLLIVEGRLSQARQIAEELSVTVPPLCQGRSGAFLETWASYRIVLARVLIADGQFNQAVSMLTGLSDELNALNWQCLSATISLLLAVALEQSGARQEALTRLGHGLAIGQAAGMFNTFVDEGAPVRELLGHWRSAATTPLNVDSVFVDRLLAALDVHAVQPASGSEAQTRVAAGLLSSREIEILNHVARGLSNKEIGRELQVTAETVKWHMKNIFEKLKVGTRVEAVQKGLGLIAAKRADMD